MPRTATTFLQRRFFPQLPGIEYFGLPYTQINPAFNRMLFEDESTYDPEILKKEISALPGDKKLFSNESFVGQSLYWHFGNRTQIAKRLHDAMPDATVILFLRNQPDLIRSLYEIALQDRETATLSDYIQYKVPEYTYQKYLEQPAVDLFEYSEFNTYNATERLHDFDYLPLIKLYKSLFPRVEIFLFEDFKSDRKGVLQRLSEVLEVDVSEDFIDSITHEAPINRGVNARQARKLRRLNRWRDVLYAFKFGRAFYVRAKRRILKKEGGEKIHWSAEEQATLQSVFADCNKRLVEEFPEIGIDRYAKEYLIEAAK